MVHSTKEVADQRSFFAERASDYDSTHSENDENGLALAWLLSWLRFHDCRSYLEIGARTGRSLRTVLEAYPQLRCVGIEPVEAMREQGYRNGLSGEQLRSGDACDLPYEDSSFDVVAEFASLHHIADSKLAVQEMIRV